MTRATIPSARDMMVMRFCALVMAHEDVRDELFKRLDESLGKHKVAWRAVNAELRNTSGHYSVQWNRWVRERNPSAFSTGAYGGTGREFARFVRNSLAHAAESFHSMVLSKQDPILFLDIEMIENFGADFMVPFMDAVVGTLNSESLMEGRTIRELFANLIV